MSQNGSTESLNPLLVTNAVDIARTDEVHATVGNGGRGMVRIAQIIDCQRVELRARLAHVAFARRCEEQMAASVGNGTGPRAGHPFQSRGEHLLAIGRSPAFEHIWIV